jgi:thymidylate synthase (FAD)
VKVDVLDKGYVRLVEEGCTGSDLTVVNSARVSYAKESAEFGDKDAKLINFLAREGHTSPFRHAFLQFEVYAPLMVARQWWKYVVGSDHTMDAWNESSRRYVTEEAVFYEPNMWRSAPENSKQGSGGAVSKTISKEFDSAYANHVSDSIKLYESALRNGVCAEQARLFLPAYGMYVRWYWTASVASVAHLINQRVAHDAQKEFQDYAKVVKELAETRLPHSIAALTRP